jgi:hypothetical protein
MKKPRFAVFFKGKPANVIQVKAGDVLYFPVTTHTVKNAGNNKSRVILT